jgi:hypothetical protein
MVSPTCLIHALNHAKSLRFPPLEQFGYAVLTVLPVFSRQVGGEDALTRISHDIEAYPRSQQQFDEVAIPPRQILAFVDEYVGVYLFKATYDALT